MNDYFRKRALQIEDESYALSSRYLKRVKRLMRESQEEVLRDVDALYRKYAVDNKLTYAEAKKVLNSSELREWRSKIKDIDKKIKELRADEKYDALDKVIMRERISRLDSLYTQIKARTDLAYAEQQRIYTELLSDVYKQSLYQNIYTIQNNIKVYSSFNLVNDTVIKSVLSRKNQGETFSSRIWEKHRIKLFTDVQNEIAKSIATGRTSKDIAEKIAGRYEVAYSNAERLVRTESAFFMNEATSDSYVESDIEKYEYLATLDSKTSEDCRKLDGEIISMKDKIVGINFPPLHPRCRSTTVAHFDFLSYKERAMRNADGKTVVGKNMTYYEWLEKFGDN